MRRPPILAMVVGLVLVSVLPGSGGPLMARFYAASGTNPLAYLTLTRYGTSPVLALGAAGQWDDAEIDGESVFYDSRLGKWVMAYGGYSVASGVAYKIGLAYSTDLLHWTKEASNPVLSPAGSETNLVAPTIVQLADLTYRLYYQDYGGPLTGRIFAASSSDLLTWTRLNSGNAVLLPDSPVAWDDSVVFDPYPVLDGSTWRLWFGGQKTSDSSRGIGVTTSADGISFGARTELLTPAGGEAQQSFGAPALVFTNATHYTLFHDAAASGSSTTRYINKQVTTDGSTFTRTGSYLTANPSGWDSVQVFDPAPIVYNGALYLFYAGAATTGSSSGLGAQIGLATVKWP